ncbi:7289_t:CDS:2 [Paraglomus occultum]|uniref:Glutathione S-transferase 3, mitochondrial n=1 Tax=Paraglomus occultum TaxID=144539 RepID=A0A9N9FSR3_9GLOM|nr:7289_t:CDS:2 [Paraglomus occultum]
MTTITISSDYGYVLLAGVASTIMTTYLGLRVGGARARAKVPYPFLYAEKAEAEQDKDKMVFNCYQRAHQNTLENYPSFLLTLFVAGVGFPKIAAASGFVWIASRLAYAHGYYTGDPKKRSRGFFGYIGMLTLLATSTLTGVKTITNGF